jgi:hypothetical protein
MLELALTNEGCDLRSTENVLNLLEACGDLRVVDSDDRFVPIGLCYVENAQTRPLVITMSGTATRGSVA